MSQPDRNAPYLLGHDVGGTKLAVVIADRNGNILHKVRRPTEAERGPEAVVATLVDMSREAMARACLSSSDLAGVGVSCGGPLDTETGVVYAPPNLPGWDEVPLKAWLERALSLPAFVENDANAGALAEWSFGAGRGFRHMVYMTMSTGIGGGIILDGRLYRGPNDTAGGADTFVFRDNSANGTITDPNDPNVVIDLSGQTGGGSITLQDFTLADLDENDFVFCEAPPDGG